MAAWMTKRCNNEMESLAMYNYVGSTLDDIEHFKQVNTIIPRGTNDYRFNWFRIYNQSNAIKRLCARVFL